MRKFEEVEEFFKCVEGDTKLPTRGTKFSSGYDFYLKEDIALYPNETKVIWTDIKAQMNEDEVLLLHVRSSIGIGQGLVLANGTGVIDADYYNNAKNDGNIAIALYNTSGKMQTLSKGDRVMQGIFVKYLVVDENDITLGKRKGGIGSTNG